MLVMEYVPMGCLLTYLRTEKERVTDQQLIKFATDVAEVYILSRYLIICLIVNIFC